MLYGKRAQHDPTQRGARDHRKRDVDGPSQNTRRRLRLGGAGMSCMFGGDHLRCKVVGPVRVAVTMCESASMTNPCGVRVIRFQHKRLTFHVYEILIRLGPRLIVYFVICVQLFHNIGCLDVFDLRTMHRVRVM